MQRVAAEHAHDQNGGVGSTVAGRYEIEEELARGGMGRVYRARDLSRGEYVALKRLQGETSAKRSLRGLFEREYRTLRSLKHPRIIEVHDYGVDRDGAYYTMELLSGMDLGKLAPLPYQQACAYLRDVASSLALLHARRLLHRDVSPQNVRVTGDGRCKLLDFGVLTGFGVAGNVVGTPPCIPPEAVRGAPLDQRADLYALGATAYYLLTRRHAYPAKSISDLIGLWHSGAPKPSHYVAGLPPALEALVVSLIHHDPLARPESAAEVIDRLNAIADLPSDDEPQAAASYFFSAALVAREAELERIAVALRAAVEGKGAALLLLGASGVGRSRLLGEACVQAQLAGATVLQVDADRERRDNGVALSLATKLLDAAPVEALRAVGPHAPVLVRVFPELAEELGTRERAEIPETPGEWRGRVQAALSAWLSGVAESRALVIAVDNLEAADDSSAALLAALASECHARKLLVLAALRTERASQVASGVRFLRESAAQIELSPLTSEQTIVLARAMFGDVPNVMRLGEWMHRASAGNVSYCFELATELRSRGIVRYGGGTWVLPEDAQAAELPQGMADALQQRIARLSPAGLGLAEALSVHGLGVGIETCRAVADAAGVQDAFAALDELVEKDVVLVSGDRYRFAQDGLRELVAQRIDRERRKRLHRAMADALLASSAPEDRISRVEAGWHMLRGGEELRGAQLLERTALEFEIGTGSLQAAIPALEEARKVYWKHGRSLYELLPIVTRLAAEGYYSDRRLSMLYADEAFGLLRKATGLDLAERLSPAIGRKLGVYAGLALAAMRFYATPRSRRMPRFSDVFVLLVNCVTTQAGAGTVCLETDAMRRAAAFIEPLTELGPRHITSAIHDYCVCLMQMSLECEPEVREGWSSLLERLSDPEQFQTLPDYVRQLYRGGALFALGIVETWHDGEEALTRAHELESLGLRIYDRAATQIRMLYHGGRGELAQAEDCRKRMELHAIQTGSAWQVEVTVPLTLAGVYFWLGDVVGLKRATEQIEQLAVRFQSPSLERSARLARANFLLLRGSTEEAIAAYRAVLDETPPRGFLGQARGLGHLADACNRLGRHDDALRVCEDALSHVRPQDRRFVRMFLVLEIQLALAEAGLGRAEDAAQRLDALIAEHEGAANPLTLGMLHEARARVAFTAQDKLAFERHSHEVERWYRPTRVPGLIACAERLAQQGEEVFSLSRRHGSEPRPETDAVSTALSALSQCTDGHTRCERALELVLQQSGASEGHLFLVTAGGDLALAASLGAESPPPGLQHEAAQLVREFRGDGDATRLETRGPSPTLAHRGLGGAGEYRSHLLWSMIDGQPDLVGVVAVRDEGEPRPLGFQVLQALAEGLRAGLLAS